MANDLPNPGSEGAAELGCTCPRLDNGHGRGCGHTDDKGKPLFWIAEGCPLHDHMDARKGPAAAKA